MSGEGAVVGKDHVVADDAVVRDVAVREEVVPAADARVRPGSGAAIDGDELAEGIPVADLEVASARRRISDPASAGRWR